mmetsp:Transcript_65513/g.146178  ORF Transcript_65513/g.146178 Transcript_65513/m.146178 type:complete len:217 (+) Transcript_65513:160-810(+)
MQDLCDLWLCDTRCVVRTHHARACAYGLRGLLLYSMSCSCRVIFLCGCARTLPLSPVCLVPTQLRQNHMDTAPYTSTLLAVLLCCLSACRDCLPSLRVPSSDFQSHVRVSALHLRCSASGTCRAHLRHLPVPTCQCHLPVPAYQCLPASACLPVPTYQCLPTSVYLPGSNHHEGCLLLSIALRRWLRHPHSALASIRGACSSWMWPRGPWRAGRRT